MLKTKPFEYEINNEQTIAYFILVLYTFFTDNIILS